MAVFFGLAACSGSDSNGDETAPAAEEEAADEAADEAATHTYTVRGRIDALPTEEQSRIQIFHEEISDFVNQQGEASGMAAMSMPFGVKDDVSLEGFEAGDLIEFTFEVDWSHPEVSRVTAISELPEGTELELD